MRETTPLTQPINMKDNQFFAVATSLKITSVITGETIATRYFSCIEDAAYEMKEQQPHFKSGYKLQVIQAEVDCKGEIFSSSEIQRCNGTRKS